MSRTPWLSRSVKDLDALFGIDLKALIEGKVKANQMGSHKVRNISVLEVGYGKGNLLSELSDHFGQGINLYGINYCGVEKFDYKEEGYAKLFEYDAGEYIRFGDESLDFVVSQYAFHYIKDKKRTVEEVWRVLKVGGEAYIHFDSSRDFYADFLRLPTPRFVIYDKENLVSTKVFFDKLSKAGYGLHLRESFKNKKDTILLIQKTNRDPLNINLELDEISTIDLRRLRKEVNDGHKWWGYRTVYRILQG